MGKLLAIIIGVLLGLVILCVFSAIPAIVLWLVWGPVAVEAFHLPVLSFWQCWGLLIICGLLIKSHVNVDKSS